MKLKEGAIVTGLKPEMILALMIIEPILESHGQELVLTEGTGGQHSSTSRHYIGYAVDIRTWSLRDANLVEQVAEKLRKALGPEFVVVVEPTHIHIQFNGVPR